jgi:hypothetical protein
MFKAPLAWMSVIFFPARWGINQARWGINQGRSGLIDLGLSMRSGMGFIALGMGSIALGIVLAAIIMKMK